MKVRQVATPRKEVPILHLSEDGLAQLLIDRIERNISGRTSTHDSLESCSKMRVFERSMKCQ